MKIERLFLDVHVVQTVPPSNINRDDTGSPKTATYGGVTRARVSSQSWKRAMREYFKNNLQEDNGYRTLEIVKLISDEIQKMNSNISEVEAIEKATQVITSSGVSVKNNKAKALFFISEHQARKMADAALKGVTKKDELQGILNSNPSLDMALFGRMVADDPLLNEDASAQVAHAISTHNVQTEFDFYTGSDDLKSNSSSGAGMLGTIEFNSSTLYRYTNIAVHELFKQLGNDFEKTIKAIASYVEAFVQSMPSGKINSFANQTLPQAIIVILRSDRPVNLVSAFESPVKGKDGYVNESIAKLYSEFEKSTRFVKEPLKTMTIGLSQYDYELESFPGLVQKLKDDLSELLK